MNLHVHGEGNDPAEIVAKARDAQIDVIAISKSSRQLIMVTHNANIPVLGDADHVIEMQNEPTEAGGRRCVTAGCACFELPKITDALLALEGGREAFRFRQHRYSLPRTRGLIIPVLGEVS